MNSKPTHKNFFLNYNVNICVCQDKRKKDIIVAIIRIGKFNSSLTKIMALTGRLLLNSWKKMTQRRCEKLVGHWKKVISTDQASPWKRHKIVYYKSVIFGG